MKILHHPLHVMLIHFPTALLPMDLVLSYLFYTTGNESFGSAAFYCLIAGVGLGLLSGVTGLIDLVMIKDKAAMSAALIHGGINLTAILIFSVFAYRSWNLYPQIQLPAITVLVVKLIIVVLMLVGNYLGGRLILKHHIAIEP
ncbi:MAG TPA: DUF2231 domain-containing protein [Flavisolibacter sp.]|jgi:uncharacterized membrane protein|nr:DUF2231 domain-containing protein [Flavisolibacter sp.]